MIHLVVGPPCGGKSTHVTQHAQPGDLVIDWDDIAIRLGSPRSHLHAQPLLPQVAAEYDRLLELAHDWPADVWIVRGLPDQAERAQWVARFDAQLVVCTAPRAVLLERAAARSKTRLTIWSIDRWLARAASDRP